MITQVLLIFCAGLLILLIGRLTLKEYKKWRLALTIVGSLLMSLPFLISFYLIFLILTGRN